jgi:hypothetical protein
MKTQEQMLSALHQHFNNVEENASHVNKGFLPYATVKPVKVVLLSPGIMLAEMESGFGTCLVVDTPAYSKYPPQIVEGVGLPPNWADLEGIDLSFIEVLNNEDNAALQALSQGLQE